MESYKVELYRMEIAITAHVTNLVIEFRTFICKERRAMEDELKVT